MLATAPRGLVGKAREGSSRQPSPANPPHCLLTYLIMCLTTTVLSREQRGAFWRKDANDCSICYRGTSGGEGQVRVRPGRAGGAATRSAGVSGARIHAAGAGAKLAPAEWMLNYRRPQGLSHSGEAPGEALSRAGEGSELELVARTRSFPNHQATPRP